jgi:SAM-dependent methyltransferase
LWLSKQEDAYTPIYNILSQQKWLNVLEIWSWFGYLTYAINQLWHKCIWADISDVAVNKAKENFGDYYVQWDVFLDTKQSNVYDIVVATELIEHIDDYKKFFIWCHKVLKPWWKVLLTTPNKDFFWKKHIWIWDLPPIHTTWMTKQSFKLANQKIFSKVDFYPLWNYCKDTNYLFQKVLRNIIKRDSISKPVIRLDDNQEDVHNNINNWALYKFFLILQPIIEAKLIQKISNYINRKLFWSIDSCTTLCIVLEK